MVIATGIGPLPGELAISAVTLAELHLGVFVAGEQAARAERLRRLSILQRQFDALRWMTPLPRAMASWQPPWSSLVANRGRAQ